MSVYSLNIEDFSEDNYTLIGIHSVLENYQLAYLLNQHLQIGLKRTNFNLDLKRKNHQFSYAIYEYTDKIYDCNWFLIENSCKIKTESVGLFAESEVKSALISEKKKIDFFLKIEGELNSSFIGKIITKINTIKQIVTSYEVEANNLKSKELLIF